jgi:regulator of protease activity HflC (stomatin/prohibitin superfamily)
MAAITRLPFLRHLRSETSSHVLHARGGHAARSGRGLAFWFLPLSASISELPADDRELAVLFHARTRDFQDVTAEAVITWRVERPEALAERVDFAIDLATGQWLKKPLEQIGTLLTQQAQHLAWDHIAQSSLAQVLESGIEGLGHRISTALSADETLAAMGIAVVGFRLAGIHPDPEVGRALQTPARELMQQAADRATFERRAAAVEQERAIAENELNNRIELAKREEQLIRQQGQNAQRKATDEAETQRIAADAAAARTRTERSAEADGYRAVASAQVQAESDRIAIYRDLPQEVLLGMAARELAGHLPAIGHLSLGGDALGPVLTRLMQAGSRKLEQEG